MYRRECNVSGYLRENRGFPSTFHYYICDNQRYAGHLLKTSMIKWHWRTIVLIKIWESTRHTYAVDLLSNLIKSSILFLWLSRSALWAILDYFDYLVSFEITAKQSYAFLLNSSSYIASKTEFVPKAKVKIIKKQQWIFSLSV